MASKSTLRRFAINEEALEKELTELLGENVDVSSQIEGSVGDVEREQIVSATVLALDETRNRVLVDIGGKAEAPIPFDEFEDGLPEVGTIFEVYYRGDDRHTNVPAVSKREADRERAWAKVIGVYEVDDVIEGEVKKKIKGGLLIDVDGVLVFMPASQIDLRRTPEPADFIGIVVRAKIVKIDLERKNIVVSRRQLLEEERAEKRAGLLNEIQEGQVRQGEVKNIADFGAFVDLGGMDGLLHITDMTYGRIKHPREMVRIGDKLDVMILKVDRDRNRVALSLKALTKDPWAEIAARFPQGSVQKGKVANIMPYGLFVELEPGVEGLVHVTELSWARQNPNPEAEYERGQEIDVFVKELDLEKKEMSLSIREVEGNPWDEIAEAYAPGTVIEATVKNLASYGAFVEIEEGIDGLLHNTDFHWTRKIQHPSEVVRKGDRIQCVVLAVDREKQRISLGMKQLTKNPWEDYIPANYHVGDMIAGTITKAISAGCFVQLEEDLEAFLHYSTVPHEWQTEPEIHCISGLKVEVRVVRVDCGEERIGLSFIHAEFEENDEVRAKHEEAKAKKAARKAARKAKEESAGEGEKDAEATPVAEVEADSEGESLESVEPARVIEPAPAAVETVVEAAKPEVAEPEAAAAPEPEASAEKKSDTE
jgi:small subunit ribosomal protein S1